MIFRIMSLFLLLALFGCSAVRISYKKAENKVLDSLYDKSGTNAKKIITVLGKIHPREKKAALYLLSHMPEKDLRYLSSQFILDQLKWAFIARDEFSWCSSLPDSIFFNEVLPYCNLDEDRDNWREQFYMYFQPKVKNCRTIYEAIDSVNLNIQKILGVDYNVNRSKVNISTLQAIKEKMATCTGLSILLIDAFRSVGIPARIAGTPMWTNMRGNHSWVEVWINGEWYFTEYYPDGLNKSWFVEDAGKADNQKPEHRIYAASYKPTGLYFPLVWDSLSTDIHAVNVTDRYIRLYENQQSLMTLNDDELWGEIVIFESPRSDKRISRRISVKQGETEVNFGYSPSDVDDLNRFLKIRLKKNTDYTFEFADSEGTIISAPHKTGSEKSEKIILYVKK